MCKNIWITSMENPESSHIYIQKYLSAWTHALTVRLRILCSDLQPKPKAQCSSVGPQAPLIWVYLCCKSLPPCREMFELTAAKSSDRGGLVSYPPVGVCTLQITRVKLFTCGSEFEHRAKNNSVVLKSVETLYMVTRVYCAVTL